MLKPFRLLNESLKQFVIGFAPGLVMAFLCLAIQIILLSAVTPVLGILVPTQPEPELPLGSPEWFEWLMQQDRGWRYDARELLKYTLTTSLLFFFHALVAVILTAWLLRNRAGFEPGIVLRRAVRGAGLITGAASLVFAASYFFDNVYRATRTLSFDFKSAALVAVWFVGTTLLLPARVMGHAPAAAPGFLKTTLVATIVMVPWFYVSEIFGAPLRHCYGCGGFFEGGLIFIPMLGAYFLSLTVSSAAVSAAACMPAKTQTA